MIRSNRSLDSLGAEIEQVAELDTTITGRRERIDIMKTAIREVMKEWLDERFRAVGKWTSRGFFAAVFTAVIYFILTHTGWKHP